MYKRAPLEDRLFQRKRGRVWYFWAYDHNGDQYSKSTRQTDKQAALSVARQKERELAVSPSVHAADPSETFTLGQALNDLSAHDARVEAAVNTVRFHIDRGRHLIQKLRWCPECAVVVVAIKHDDEGNAIETRTIGEEPCRHTPEADTRIPCRMLSREVMQVYCDARLAEGDKRHTIQKEQRVLVHALNLAAGVGKYVGDPKALRVEGFTKAKGKRGFYKPGGTWLEKPEYVDALVRSTSMNPDKHRIDRRDDILVYVNLGLRRRELLLVCPEHVDLHKRIVRVRRLLDRSGKEIRSVKTDGSLRELPLNDVMVAMFTRRLVGARAGVPLFQEWGSGNRDLKANWNRARAGLIADAGKLEANTDLAADLDATLPRSLTFNDLRRTFCSLMKAAGVSFEDCADLLGHEDISMVRLVYGRTAMETLHRAVSRLPRMSLPEATPQRVKGSSRRERQRAKAAHKRVSKVGDTLNASIAETIEATSTEAANS